MTALEVAVALLLVLDVALLVLVVAARRSADADRDTHPAQVESWLDHRAGVHADPCPYTTRKESRP